MGKVNVVEGDHTLTGDKLLSVRSAATLLDIHRTTLYYEIKEGRLPVIKCDKGRTLIWQSDLQRWLAERYTGIE